MRALLPTPRLQGAQARAPRLQGAQARKLAAGYLRALRRGQTPHVAMLGPCACGTYACWGWDELHPSVLGGYLRGTVVYRALRYAMAAWGWHQHCAA